MTIRFSFYTLLQFLFCVSSLSADTLSSEEKAFFKSIIIPLKTLEAGHELADLMPCKPLMQDVQVLALGEATHGTKEFFQFKHRMLEYFVREMGCRLFAIEASYVQCLPINEYILTGKGDLETVVAGQGFWCWNTVEVASMVEWMRQYNLSVGEEEKIQFYGIDCQVNGAAGKDICALISTGLPDYYMQASSLLEFFHSSDAIFFAEISYLQDLKKHISEVLDHLTTHANQWKGSSTEYEEALFLLDLLKQECAYMITQKNPAALLEGFIVLKHPELMSIFTKEGPDIFYSEEMLSNYPEIKKIIQEIDKEQSLRDFSMAQNVLRLLNKVKGPIVVWAHNSHVSFDKRGRIHPMGYYLKEKLQSAYYAMGFVTSQGTFQSKNYLNQYKLEVFPLPSSLENSWDEFCAQLGEEKFILDFRKISTHKWLNTPHFLQTFGSCFSTDWTPHNYYSSEIPIDYFDGLIYLRYTNASDPLKSE